MNPYKGRVLWTSKVLVVPVPTGAPISYEAYRVEGHDDLVLSVGFTRWAGERYLRCRMYVRARPKGL